jgi:hypothetical protein
MSKRLHPVIYDVIEIMLQKLNQIPYLLLIKHII